MSADFDLWARELAQHTETQPMPPRRRTTITVAISIMWLIIGALLALVFIGAWVVGTHIINLIVGT